MKDFRKKVVVKISFSKLINTYCKNILTNKAYVTLYMIIKKQCSLITNDMTRQLKYFFIQLVKNKLHYFTIFKTTDKKYSMEI